MGEFNSDDHHIYYSGQEPIRRNGVAIIVIRRVQNAVLGCNLKNLYDQPRQHIKKQRHYFANKGPSSQGYGFSSGHVCM